MNIVSIEDSAGDVIDRHQYCSDSCAQTDPAYAGWYGCVEQELDEHCLNCGEIIRGYLSPEEQAAMFL